MRILLVLLLGLTGIHAGAVRAGEPAAASLSDTPRNEFVRIDKVPTQFRNLFVNDQSSIEPLLPTLAITGREQFQFEEKSQAGGMDVYAFREWVDDVRTDNLIYFFVNKKTRALHRIGGSILEGSAVPAEPAVGQREAIDDVLGYLRSGGSRPFDVAYVEKGSHKTVKLLREGKLWWGVGIQLAHGPLQGVEPYEWYWVSPAGVVSEWIEGGSANVDVTVCDGSGDPTQHFCSSSLPTVINTSGQCQQGYNCSGTKNDYQTPWDTAHAVDQMWQDLLSAGCCDVGTNNEQYGGDVEIDVGGDPGSGSQGRYYAYQMGPSHIKRAGMVLDDLYSHDPRIAAHELGHAFHAKRSWNTFMLGTFSGTVLTRAEYEHNAIFEYIGDVNQVIYYNYVGNGSFVSDPNWTTFTGSDFSQNFTYGDMSGAWTAYKNARVGGHAFYVLAQKLGLHEAARDFLASVSGNLRDRDSNGHISWDEVRSAMIDACLDQKCQNAVKDAWHDVGVGASSGTNSDPQDPSAPPPQGAPGRPDPLSATLYQSCASSSLGYFTGYSVSYANVSGAGYYEFFHNFGSGYQFTGDTTNNPEIFWSNATAQVKVRACNSSGCSALSSDTVTATYLCE